MSDPQSVLEASVKRLREVVAGLDPTQYTAKAYPTEWSIADVMSHLGSGAVIMAHSIDTTIAGTAVADDFNQSVWDEWNSKLPAAQVADSLVADQDLMARVAQVSASERATFQISVGPMSLGFDGALGLRLGEHALHTWDIEIVSEPDATLPAEAAGLIVDTISMLVGFVGKPDGVERDIAIHTTDPARDFVLTLGAVSVSLAPAAPAPVADLTIPTEALIRLVYGRLDPAHTPAGVDEVLVATLRPIFPGF
jgi:uncharacterized protein (TIGR03083 family)